MTLQNLLAIKRLQEHVADHAAVQRLLSAARRNLADYEGDPISDAALKSCIDEAAKLLGHTENWLRQHDTAFAKD